MTAPLSGEGTATLSVKIPLGMKEAIRRRAAAEGMTPSEFARAALSENFLLPVDASDVPLYRIEVVADVALKTF